ncbi:chemotaxis protein CheW [Pseudomonas schmalbachii]|uniref:Chemotaxis protein CheW n=1 Tax=Pseudomonas schmalbachii TaxID=2816993 RepID=A0ABS3TNT0_9PSED|nr:chemotaxis protein CheW [Pseudomonas schmalbachii]MBO3274813.1 chemotaxis protein CheW [Pseudomonas schmalbachii]
MFERGDGLQLDWAAHPVDDCWRRIGVRGDKSCERLAEHIHCRNCPVYSTAATGLLDRYAFREGSVARLEHVEENQPPIDSQSCIVFRLGEEWLALASRALVEVVPVCAVHSLPHPRSPALLGVANVRGALVACLSLVELLGLPPGHGEEQGRNLPRMLILAAPGGPILAPVDEVAGIHPLSRQEIVVDPSSALAAGDRFTEGAVQWRSRTVRLLQHETLLDAATRSLA